MTPEAAQTIRTAADIVQWINLAAAVVILAVALEFGRRMAGVRPYLLGPVTWAAHSIVFYVFALLNGLPGPVASLWSAILRLHGYLILLALLVAAFVVALSPAPLGEWAEDENDG